MSKLQILCGECHKLKTDLGAVKISTMAGLNWFWRCKDCTDLLDESLRDLGVME